MPMHFCDTMHTHMLIHCNSWRLIQPRTARSPHLQSGFTAGPGHDPLPLPWFKVIGILYLFKVPVKYEYRLQIKFHYAIASSYLTRGGTLTIFMYYWMNFGTMASIHACYIHIHTLLELWAPTEGCNLTIVGGGTAKRRPILNIHLKFFPVSW